MTASPARWDIFCKVVDNYGDAGISWRLARALAAAHGLDVTLWLDLVAPLAAIAPGVAADRAEQRVQGVTVRLWSDPLPPAPPPAVVIEAFGCGLPDDYVAAMAAAAVPPSWFVLEYLSAEPWVDGSHGLASPHPRLPLARRFWFPGFTARTGGLLRERGLFAARDAFRADPVAQRALWAALGAPPPAAGAVKISLFCYDNPALPALLDAFAGGEDDVACFIPQGVAGALVDGWAGRPVSGTPGASVTRGRLALRIHPFVSQDAYDRLLWACDVNFVRGEDSVVRAQWAARPFVWQIYRQADAAHLPKLDALADRYTAGLDPAPQAAVQRMWRAWNGGPGAPPAGPAWAAYAHARPALAAHGPVWAAALAAMPDLATELVKAARNGV